MVGPAHDEVDVWIVDLGTTGADEQLVTTLSPQEAARFAGADPGERDRAAARAALRMVLGRYLDIAPAEIALVEADAAKPAIAGARLEFNVAHTEDLALIAVAGVAVGVDVERVEPIPAEELDDLVDFVFAEREAEELAGVSERERLVAYYRVWTRKEAYVKATGEGIAGRPLPEVVVGVAEPTLVEVMGVAEDELAGWSVGDIEVPTGYVASVVAQHPRPRLTVRAWGPPA